MIEKLRKTFALRGLIPTLLLVIREYVFRYSKEFVIVRSLANEGYVNPSYRYQRIGLDDRELLRGFPSPYRYEELCEYLTRGDFIFVAFHQKRPVGFHIVSPRPRIRLPYSSIKLRNDQAWVVDIYSVPEYREQHVAASLRTFRESYLLHYGFSETIGAIRESNTPSLKYACGVPSREVKYMKFLRILFYTKLTIIPDAAKMLERLLVERGVGKPNEMAESFSSRNEIEVPSQSGG